MKWLVAAAWVLGARAAVAQTAETEPAAVIELGLVPTHNLTDRTWSVGATAAVEVSPIEHWLELEAGVTRISGHRSTEWSIDFLLKKPWTLSPSVEFMIGLGPEWVHTSQSLTARNEVAGEAVLDFMFWPSRKHAFGWYVEPSFERSFARGHEQSLGASVGLLIAIPRR